MSRSSVSVAMLNQFAKCVLLFTTIFCIVIPLHGIELPPNFTKCPMNNDICLANTATTILQNPNGYPGLGIPNLDPFVSPQSYELLSTRFSSIVTATLRWSNIAVSGMRNAVFQEIRGFQPNQPKSEVHFRITVDSMKISVDTASDIEFQLMQLKTTGNAIATVENGELLVTARVSTVQRLGKTNINIDDVSTSCDASNLKIKVTYPNASTFWNNAANQVVNGNWRLFKNVMYDSFEKYCLGILLQKYIMPVLNQIACEDFINI